MKSGMIKKNTQLYNRLRAILHEEGILARDKDYFESVELLLPTRGDFGRFGLLERPTEEEVTKINEIVDNNKGHLLGTHLHALNKEGLLSKYVFISDDADKFVMKYVTPRITVSHTGAFIDYVRSNKPAEAVKKLALGEELELRDYFYIILLWSINGNVFNNTLKDIVAEKVGEYDYFVKETSHGWMFTKEGKEIINNLNSSGLFNVREEYIEGTDFFNYSGLYLLDHVCILGTGDNDEQAITRLYDGHDTGIIRSGKRFALEHKVIEDEIIIRSVQGAETFEDAITVNNLNALECASSKDSEVFYSINNHFVIMKTKKALWFSADCGSYYSVWSDKDPYNRVMSQVAGFARHDEVWFRPSETEIIAVVKAGKDMKEFKELFGNGELPDTLAPSSYPKYVEFCNALRDFDKEALIAMGCDVLEGNLTWKEGRYEG